ncbi:MAG: UvrD-helicase domain-containing protein [Clostridiales bacterium]|nr:UvrD-helicase domain-containing protein [Clostridiales bacterium]
MDFSRAQNKVIGNPTDNILVSAAAGSGKTTVLVERIIERIRTGQLSIDNILVVTFTNDAAVNMQRKIEEALRKEYNDSLSDNEAHKRFGEQLDKLSNAYIQTFDSFCTRVVSERGYVLAEKGIDRFEPGFAVLDEGELKLLRSRAAADAVENAYLKEASEECDGRRSDFILLTERCGDGRSDAELIKNLVATYEKLRCLAEYRTKIQVSCSEYENSSVEDRLYPVLSAIIGRLKECSEHFDEFKDIIGTDDKNYIIAKGKLKPDARTSESCALVDRIRDGILSADAKLQSKAPAEDIINALMAVDVSEVKVGKQYLDKTLPEAQAFLAVCNLYKANGIGDYQGAYDLSDGYNKIFKIFKDNTFENLKRMSEENKKAVRAFTELLLDMDDRYAALKYSIRGMDFADQEYAASDIFDDTEASDYYRNKFSEIYVDEYQDNTDLQDEIIKKISRNGKNVFRVGDVKQSIYRFRNSDPSIFTGMLEQMEEDHSRGTPLYLNENFRSRREILNFINFIFLQLMDKEVCGIDYPKQMLNFPDSQKEYFDPYYIPDVLVVDQTVDGKSIDESSEEDADNEDTSFTEGAEFAGVSEDEDQDVYGSDVDCLKYGVESLILDYLAKDPEKHRLSDICVLTETRRMANSVTEYLNDCGIDAAGINITQIFTDNDIHRLASLIICLGNSCRDEYLLGVLFAPFEFSDFTFEEVAHINAYLMERNIDLKISLIDRLRIYCSLADEETEGELYLRTEHFIDVFDDLRSFAMTSAIASTAEEVFKKTHIRATLEYNFGNSNKINLFKKWLVSNFERFGTDISGIASELEQMKIKLAEAASVETRDSNPDLVTVMNVHKSKGLEFKYVILVLKPQKKHSENSVSGICFDDKDGWNSDWYDDKKLCRKTSIEMILKNEKIVIEDNSELMRLLYVALTRAQNKLSIVMSAASGGGKTDQPFVAASENARLMAYPELKRPETILRAKTGGTLYFMLLALMRTPYWNNALEARFGETGITCQDALTPVDKDTFKDLLDDNDPVTVATLVQGYPDDFDEDFEDYDGPDLYGSDEEDDEPFDFDDLDDFDEDDEDSVPVDPSKIEAYKYQKECEIPFKVSVTAVASGNFTRTTHVDMNIRSREEYGHGRKKLSSAAKGTILHILMRAAEPEDILSDYEGTVDALIQEGFFAGADAASVREVCSEFKEGVKSFFASDIGRRLEDADKKNMAKYEYPLVFSVYSDPEEPERGSVLVQGIADLVFGEDDGLVILDYKTDNLPGMNEVQREEEARKRHSVQIDSYAQAFAKSGKKVKEKWIYLVRYSQFVRIL